LAPSRPVISLGGVWDFGDQFDDSDCTGIAYSESQLSIEQTVETINGSETWRERCGNDDRAVRWRIVSEQSSVGSSSVRIVAERGDDLCQYSAAVENDLTPEQIRGRFECDSGKSGGWLMRRH
jgi:hypothetical protein